MHDLRDDIFRDLAGKTARGRILADADGIVAGTGRAGDTARGLGLDIAKMVPEGTRVWVGDLLGEVTGELKPVFMGEERLLGCISKPSGVATAARRFVEAAGQKPRIVSGAWKKMPFELKEPLRMAVKSGGACIRITNAPFVYLDKNYVSVFGGVKQTLVGVSHMKGFEKVIQIKGRLQDIEEEALDAAKMNAAILFVDTGRLADIRRVADCLTKAGLRQKVRLAFGGNVTFEHMAEIRTIDIDLLDIGQAIMDAPLLDLKYEVTTLN